MTQPIEWGLEKPEQPIKEDRKLKFCAAFNEWTLIGWKLQGEKKKEKNRTKKEIQSVHIGYSD